MVLLLLFVVGPVLAILTLFWLLKRGRDEQKRFLNAHGSIQAMSTEEAKQRALAALSNPQEFEVIESVPSDLSTLDSFAPLLKEFFSRFESATDTSGLKLSRSEFRPATHDRAFIRIGEELPGTELECEIAVRVGDERVFKFERDGSLDSIAGVHRTIYHMIVFATVGDKG
jgi:hypothetical protein